MVFKTEIKCPICRGKAVLSKSSIDLFKGIITLKENPIYECIKCSEKFATGEIVDKTLEKAKKEFGFTRQIISSGGSLAITLPTDLSKYYGLEQGGKIKLVPKSEKELSIIIQ
ncbi:MAG: hypothetical protein AABW72_00095 [archaeon]